MAYAAVSKTVEGNLLWVQLPPSAPFSSISIQTPFYKSLKNICTKTASFCVYYSRRGKYGQ